MQLPYTNGKFHEIMIKLRTIESDNGVQWYLMELLSNFLDDLGTHLDKNIDNFRKKSLKFLT